MKKICLYDVTGNDLAGYTHEVRIKNYQPKKNSVLNDIDTYYSTHLLFKGTYEECWKYLKKTADEQGFGVGLLIHNCGYSVVDLAKERADFINSHGSELLKELQKVVNCTGYVRNNRSQIYELLERVTSPVEYKKVEPEPKTTGQKIVDFVYRLIG